jgi:hypothetical protein
LRMRLSGPIEHSKRQNPFLQLAPDDLDHLAAE